jgi:hypothetical protein
MVQFIIAFGIILVGGPGHIEGGIEAVEAKGVKPAVEAAVEQRQPYDSGTLKNYKGNFGNP